MGFKRLFSKLINYILTKREKRSIIEGTEGYLKMNNVENIDGRDLRKELDQLNIISFDSSGIMTKETVFYALDAIKEHISQNSDEEAIKHIEKLKAKKAKNRFPGNT